MPETVRLTVTTQGHRSTNNNRPADPVPEVVNAQANARGAFFDEAEVDGYHVSEHGDEDEQGNPRSRSTVTLEKQDVALDDISAAKDALAQAAAEKGLVSSTSDLTEDQFTLS